MKFTFALALSLALLAGCQTKDDTPHAAVSRNGKLDDAKLARSMDEAVQPTNNLQVVATITGPMPTGVAVSKAGRIFLNFPRWGDDVEYTVAELKDGKLSPYPNLEFNKVRESSETDGLISVQSVVVDQQDRLWILDTGSINMQPIKERAAKLLCYDLNTNELLKRITFPADVALPTTYLNDVRFNLSMGAEGTAFITDSSDSGANGIIVVDLASGTSWRKLSNHASVKADENFVPTVEGQPLMARPEGGKPAAFIKMGSDGIAISNDGKMLYYCALASRRLYSVPTATLADRNKTDDDTAKDVQFLGTRDFASDGLFTDASDNLLLTDYEHNAIRRRASMSPTEGEPNYEYLAQDPRLIWPDTMSIGGPDNALYVTANQLNRQAKFHEGKDQRKQPYVLFKIRMNESPRRG